MAKRRHRKNEPGPRKHHRRGHNPFFRRRSSHNPLSVSFARAPAILGGAIAGGVASAYIPSAVLKEKDIGWTGYLGNAAVWLIPLFFLGRWADLALGWFAGGGTMLVGRVIDDLTGKTVVTYQMPLSSYYHPSYDAALPAPRGNQLFAAPPAALPAAVGVPAGSPAIAKAKGLGWASRFMTRTAA